MTQMASDARRVSAERVAPPIKAWCAWQQGDPADVLRIDELPAPCAVSGHAVIMPVAVGLSYADVLMCRGTYQVPTPTPYVPGGESVAIVHAVGDETHAGLVGGQFFVLGGGLKQLATVPYETLYAIPPNVAASWIAGVPVNYCTAEYCLSRVAGIRPGDQVLILGAAGGVGSAAVDYAKFLGARVLAVVGGEAKARALADQGRADVVIDHTRADVRDAVMEATGGEGVAACLDPVGGAAAIGARRSIAWEGTYVTVGFASGTVPDIPLNHVLVKGYRIAGGNWGLFILHHPETVRPAVEHVLNLLGAGVLRPIVTEFPFSEGRAALVAHERRLSIGKVVVRM